MAHLLALPRKRVVGPKARAKEEGGTARVERPKGLAPCLFYLLIEFGRPMAWVPALTALHLGMIASVWGFLTVLRNRSRPIPRSVKYMFGLALLMAWNVPWAMNNRWALWGFQDFTFLVVGCVLPLAVLPVNLAAVRYILTAYVFLHVPMAIHGVLNGGHGLTGWMGDENDLALALNIALGIGIYLLLETRNKTKRLLLLILLGFFIASNVATLSRGGFVGMAALGIYLLVTGPRRGTIAICVLLAIVGLAFFAPPTYWEEIHSIKESTEYGDTGEQRLYLWGIAWRMFLAHPITGVGTQNYGIQAPYFEDVERAESTGYHTWGRVAHSLYMTVLAEQGTIGALLFLCILGYTWKTLFKLRRRARERPEDEDARAAAFMATGLSAGIFALLVTGAFLTVVYYPLFWVLTGLMGSVDGVVSARRTAAS